MRGRIHHVLIAAALLAPCLCGHAQEPEPTAEELIAAMAERLDAWDYREEVAALGALGQTAVAPLAKRLDDPDARLRVRVIYALGATKSEEALPHLIYAMADAEHEVNREAAEEIVKFGMAGLDALLSALEDPDVHFRGVANGQPLRDFGSLFETPEAPVEQFGPMAARVDGGLVIGPAGRIDPPYTIRATIEDGEQLRYRLTINDLVVTAYDRDPEKRERLEREGPRWVTAHADTLSRGGFLYVWKPNRMTGGESAGLFEYFLRKVRESDRSDFDKAHWLSAMPGFEFWQEGAAYAVLGPGADPAAVQALANSLQEGRARTFELFARKDGTVSLTANDVRVGYCVRKIRRRLGIDLRLAPGFPERKVHLTVGSHQPREVFLRTIADQLRAELTHDGEAYVLSPLAEPKPPEPEPWEVAWRKVCDWTWLRTPVVADGKVILMTEHAVLSALDLKSGKTLWQRKLAHLPDTPIVVDGVVYVGGGDNDMFAVRVADGEPLWSYTAPRPAGGGSRRLHEVRALGVHGRAALFASSDGSVFAMDRETGAKLWRREPTLGKGCALADGVLYSAGGDGSCAMDPATGELLWKNEAPMPGQGAPLKHGDRLFVSGEGRVSALSATDGSLLWQHDTERKGHMTSAMRVAADVLIVLGGRDDTSVYALDQGTGEVRWRALTRGSPARLAQDAPGRVLVTTRDGLLCAIDAGTGALLEERALGMTMWAAPVPVDDLILIVSRDPKAGGKYGRGILTAYRRER